MLTQMTMFNFCSYATKTSCHDDDEIPLFSYNDSLNYHGGINQRIITDEN